MRDRIARRARHHGLDLSSALLDSLDLYVRELARWNRKINLTAFQLDDGASDEAVDRLLMEPLLAVKHVPAGARALLDVGSGGGSPAIPLKLARPDLALTMVEVKVRKSVFLRQVSRLLQLQATDVENSRFEALLARPELHERFDVVSTRAVRLDPSTLSNLQAFLPSGGTLVNFSTTAEPVEPPPPLRLKAVHTLSAENQSRLVVMEKQRVGRTFHVKQPTK